MIKAVIFDIDGVLSERISWTELTKDLGASVDEHLDIFNQLIDGKITYEDSKSQLLKIWQSTGNTNNETFQEIFASWPLRVEAQGVIDFLRDKGIITCIITGSMDLYAKVVAEKLDIPFYYFNTELVWDDRRNLIDFHYSKDQANKKVEQFQKFRKEWNLIPKECVGVGDGPNDIELFKVIRGIALRSPNSKDLETIAWKVIDNLSEIKEII